MKLREILFKIPARNPKATAALYQRLGLNAAADDGLLLEDASGASLRIEKTSALSQPGRYSFYVRNLKYLKRTLEHYGTHVCGPLPQLAGFPGLLLRDPEGNLVRCLEKPELPATLIVKEELDEPGPKAIPFPEEITHPQLDPRSYKAASTLLDFLRRMYTGIKQLQTMMVEFSEGHCSMADLTNRYTKAYEDTERRFVLLARLGLPYQHQNPHRQLIQFLLTWSRDLPTPRIRQNYIVGLYAETLDTLDWLIDSLSHRVPPAALFPAIRN